MLSNGIYNFPKPSATNVYSDHLSQHSEPLMYKNRSKNLQYAARKTRESEAEKEAKRSPSKGIPVYIGGQCIDVGSVVMGIVKRIESYGILVSIDEIRGLVHVSEIANERISHPSEYFQIGDTIKAVVIDLDIHKLQVKLSVKQLPEYQRTR
jgi:transcriptional accessory protein Tex/SPT6